MRTSALLGYLNITDTKSYRAWCLANHPDKCRADPTATERFQQVSAEFARCSTDPHPPRAAASAAPKARSGGGASKAAPKARSGGGASKAAPKDARGSNDVWSNMAAATHAHNKYCNARVAGTAGNKCHRPRHKDCPTCYYHMPGTDHMRFVEDDPANFFNGLLLRRITDPNHFFRRARDDRMCTARTKDGRFCSGYRVKGGGDVCGVHAPKTHPPLTR